ncbi:MAG: response regulator [Pseudobutyrivibrio sp.]|nr:response regulator [Pseudobutyrivibrio sp.]
MRIAIIDDENIFRMQLKMMIGKLSEKKELDLAVEEFESGESFIHALTQKRYDIVFMDIYMPEMDGIETAKKLRELTERTFLIFMTASDGHYPDAFSLHAFDYVTKPFTIDRIEQLLDEIIEHTPMDEAFVKLSVGSVEQKLFLKNIISVTTNGHYLEFVTDNAEPIKSRLTSGEFLNLTGNDKRFLTVNRGIIINMDHVTKVLNGEVYMEDETIFPIFSRKINAITQEIKDYLLSN